MGDIQRAIRRDGARLDAVVPEADIVRREMKLALSAQDNLSNALAADIDRYTRFQAKDVYFGYSVAETDLEAKAITVNAAIVPRQRVDDIVTRLRGAGLNPSAVHGWRASASRPDATFLTINADRSPRADRILTIVLVVLVLALDTAAAYVPLWVKLDAMSDMQARIESLKTELEEAALLEKRLDESSSRNLYLVKLKKQTPSMAETLGELARVLPASAWLEQLQVREGRIQLEGFSSASADLIGTLEQSPLFSDVHFEWPVTKVSTPNTDRFDISAHIEASPGDRR